MKFQFKKPTKKRGIQPPNTSPKSANTVPVKLGAILVRLFVLPFDGLPAGNCGNFMDGKSPPPPIPNPMPLPLIPISKNGEGCVDTGR